MDHLLAHPYEIPLAAAPVNTNGDTVASVFAYAVGQMPPPPGANPAAVTDDFLRAALAHVRS